MIPLQKYLSHDNCVVQRRKWKSQHGSDTFGSLKVWMKLM